MLRPEWKRVVLALRLLGFGLLLGALSAVLPSALAGTEMEQILSLGTLVASPLTIIGSFLFTCVPRDARAHVPALVAVVFFVVELLCRLAAMNGTAGMLLVAPVFGLLGLLAHLKAVGLIGLYLRVDKIYERASSLWVLVVLLFAGALVTSIVSCLMPTVAVVVTLALTTVAALVSVAYVILVFKTASTIRALLP